MLYITNINFSTNLSSKMFISGNIFSKKEMGLNWGKDGNPKLKTAVYFQTAENGIELNCW